MKPFHRMPSLEDLARDLDRHQRTSSYWAKSVWHGLSLRALS